MPLWLSWLANVIALLVANGLAYLIVLVGLRRSGRWEHGVMGEQLPKEDVETRGKRTMGLVYGLLCSVCISGGFILAKVGVAEISAFHANFVVNVGGATARDVLALVRLMRDRVRERFGVTLETEVRLVGDFAADEGLD